MANDVWNGSGNWTGNPANWSTGVPTSSQLAEISTGSNTLSTSASVRSVQVDYNAYLTLGSAASLTTSAGILNGGTFNITGNSDTVTIGGVLNTTGTTNVGGTGLTGNTTVTAAGLYNSGTVAVQGNGSALATLRITGTTAATLTGYTRVGGNADLALNTAVTGIAKNATLELDGSQSRVSLGIGSANTAINGIAINAGSLILRGSTGLGTGGASLAIGNALNNTGSVYVDSYYNGEGGSTFSISGVLTNSGTFNVGNVNLVAATNASATGLVNNGTVNLQGTNTGTLYLATLNISGATSATTSGTTRVGGDADLQLTTGITAVGAGSQLEIDGANARISIGAGTTNSALTGLASNAGTFILRGNTGYGDGGTTVNTNTSFNNTGNLYVDSYYNGESGTTLNISGVLTNSGGVNIGNVNLGAATNVSATGLVNNGTLNLQGTNSGTLYLATLNITGATSTTTTGTTRVGGDADLQLTTGITAVGAGSQLEIDGANARVSIGAATTNSALTGLSSNAGTFILRGSTGYGDGGTTVTTTTSFNNTGSLYVDSYYNGEGGTTLSIGGTFTNYGTFNIGNVNLVADTNVSATKLVNNGTLNLQGTNSGTLHLATLTFSQPISAITSGTIRVGGDADLILNSGLTTVAKGSSLEIDGATARISIGADTANSALTGLSSNAGTLFLRGSTSYGDGGTTVTTNTSFNNTGSLYVDSYYNGEGGTTLGIGGTLTNSGTLNIGNANLVAATNVSATKLVNNGTLNLQGTNSGTLHLATLTFSQPISAITSGTIRVGGDADLILNSSLTTVAKGSSLEIDGSNARISIGADTANSALTGLSSNAGTFILRGGTYYGDGGPTVTTTTSFNNTGTLYVDTVNNGEGGTTLNLGGTLTNSGTISIGNANLSAATNVSATKLVNNGSLTLQGTNSGTLHLATLTLTQPVSAITSGSIRVGGDADLILSSGLTTVAKGSSLELDGANARISMGADTANSALTGLSSNAGTLTLRGGTYYGDGGPTVTTTTSFNNTGTLYVDTLNNGEGGTTLGFGGTFTNSGTASFGNAYLSAASTISAGSFINSGTFSMAGGAMNTASLVASGSAYNRGTLTIGSGSVLNAGANNFYQQSGTTTVAGTLTASSATASGGLLDFTTALTAGTNTTLLKITTGGTLEFDAAVDNSRTVNFSGADAGTLALGSPANFAGKIVGFSGSDMIDLLNTQVTGLSYSGNSSAGVLTVTNASGTAATLAFTGNYSTASFSTTSDGHGGTLILDPPAPAHMVASKASGPSASLSSPAPHAAAQILFDGMFGGGLASISNHAVNAPSPSNLHLAVPHAV